MSDILSTVPHSAAPKVGVILVGRRRPGFDLEWGRSMEERARGWLRAETDFNYFELAQKAVDDASLRLAVAACRAEQVETIAVLQATTADGRLAPTLAQLWPGPVILWSTPENPEGDMISSCSLVGTHCWASTLRQMSHPFEFVNGAPDQPEVQRRFREAVRLTTAVHRLRSSRFGVIGGQAPGYFAMAGEPFVMHRTLGVQVQHYSLLDFSTVLNGLGQDAVTADIARVKALNLPHKDTSDDDLVMASKLYLTMRAFFEQERLDGLTIREWPEMPNVFGQWPYLGVARLAEEGRAIGIEGDADGALTAWVGEALGFGRCYLTDWLEHDGETITTWHGGAAPLSMCAPGAMLARHFNIQKPLVIEATIRAGLPVTVARLWRCDGRYFITARQGATLKPRRHLMATNGLLRLDCQDPAEWFDELCHAGMPHHVGVFVGHHKLAFRRFARLVGAQFL